MGKLIVIVILLAIIGSCNKKETSPEQKAYNALVEKNRAIEAANPGAEQAALLCMQLADTQEQVGRERARMGQDTTGYTRKEAYASCMRNKGFGNLLK